jgi:Zn-dependent protease with chaperone function
LAAIAWAAALLCRRPELLRPWLATAWWVLLVYVGLPLLLRWLSRADARTVAATGDAWRIGRYGEADLRARVAQATAGLPARLRNPRIRIVDRRDTAAWTWLSLLWPGRHRQKTVWLTAGALHYLDPDELHAVLLHELGHHLRDHRCDIPGGWLLGEVALLALALGLGTLTLFEDAGGIALLYIGVRTATGVAAAGLTAGLHREVERLCDAFAARGAGRAATASMLLKLGEEQELEEAIQARVAQRLRQVPKVMPEDIETACAAVRPYGRIFHDNLFRHAAETAARVAADLKLKPGAAAGKPLRTPRNRELAAHLAARRALPRRRVRWRRFDSDGDGRLADAELNRLCAFLRAHPDLALFRAAAEAAPTSHPPVRERLLALWPAAETSAADV